jgi:Na+-driven multidrug efflux pump
MAAIQSVIRFYQDDGYFKPLAKLMGPLVFQNFIFAMLNIFGNVLVGQRGEVALAAVTLAGQVFFLLNILTFGITSGMAILIAQLWGKKDVASIRKVLGLCLMLTLTGAAAFITLSMTVPEKVLKLYSDDPLVIAAGIEYLQVMCWSFIGFSITFSYAVALRSACR